MTQTKKKSEKKQLMKVQLSKQDLVELLTTLKDFLLEEIRGTSRVQDHRLDCHNQRIISLEAKEKRREPKRISLCPYKDRFESVWYSQIPNNNSVLGLKYKCVGVVER